LVLGFWRPSYAGTGEGVDDSLCGKEGKKNGTRKGAKIPLWLPQEGVLRSQQEWSQSLFCFFSCPGHEETGRNRKGL